MAFKSVLQRMQQLTTDVFGNYVIQKFFEHGTAEQRRILAEQLVGQVFQLSLHMYGCRVVQKALDSVPIEQQVLLIGELKGMVLTCIEDQHGNHVIQKCIERLPTDRIGFIVDSFLGQTNRMESIAMAVVLSSGSSNIAPRRRSRCCWTRLFDLASSWLLTSTGTTWCSM